MALEDYDWFLRIEGVGTICTGKDDENNPEGSRMMFWSTRNQASVAARLLGAGLREWKATKSVMAFVRYFWPRDVMAGLAYRLDEAAVAGHIVANDEAGRELLYKLATAAQDTPNIPKVGDCCRER